MHIAVINTGGTISCVGSPLAPMTAAAFAEACTRLLDPVFAQRFPDTRLTYVTDLRFPSRAGTLDSTNLQPADWCRLADYILTHYAAYDGFVVLHGTDTLDYSGTALPLLLQMFDRDGRGQALLSKPVVLTGSQVPLFEQPTPDDALTLKFNTDAYQNLCGAVQAAQAAIPEVTIYFNGHLFRASRVRKMDANQFDAFASPNEPPLGTIGIEPTIDRTRIRPMPEPRVSLDTPEVLALARAGLAAIGDAINAPAVMLLPAVPARYDGDTGTALLATLIRAVVREGIQGLVLLGYGAGNFPSGHADDPQKGAIYQALAEADAAGVVLIGATMVPKATVASGTYAAGSWLSAVGVLSAGDMTPMAALAKLTVLLAARDKRGWSLDDVKRLMQTPLVGEIRAADVPRA